MVIDLMLGGDLRFHLDRLGPFTEEHIALVTAECSLGLGYLHAKNIIHRDMKPDNSIF
jgi:serine/threonine kinase 32